LGPVPDPNEHTLRNTLLICGVIIILIAAGVLLKGQGSSAAASAERLPFATFHLRGTISH
jgi:hypothetical protein